MYIYTCYATGVYSRICFSLYIMDVYSYCQNTAMRLFMIGHFQKGKSTLIAALRRRQQSSCFDERTKRLLDPEDQLTEDGMLHICVHCTVGMPVNIVTAAELCIYITSNSSPCTERNSTVGIQCDKWVYKRFGGGVDATHITFYTWDFAGQVHYRH